MFTIKVLYAYPVAALVGVVSRAVLERRWVKYFAARVNPNKIQTCTTMAYMYTTKAYSVAAPVGVVSRAVLERRWLLPLRRVVERDEFVHVTLAMPDTLPGCAANTCNVYRYRYR